jgi:hypothetical protein
MSGSGRQQPAGKRGPMTEPFPPRRPRLRRFLPHQPRGARWDPERAKWVCAWCHRPVDFPHGVTFAGQPPMPIVHVRRQS